MHNDIQLKRRKLNYYAKILILVSFVFFIYGFYIQISNEKKYANPDIVYNTGYDTHTIIDINSSLISDGDELVDGIKISPITDGTSDNMDGYSSHAQMAIIDDANNSLRLSIQNTYGVTIKYGSETDGYQVGGLSTVPLYDEDIINNILTRLNKAMSLYPKDLWKEIKKGGIPLTIYLIDSYSTYGVTGITDSNYNRAIISIAVQYGFEESFYHESYHYIERYMMKKGIKFTTWNSFNPSNFSYGTINGNYSYNRNFSSDVYFVNDYAQTSESEDRASTFEYMMSNVKASCLDDGKPVWRKANQMSVAIDAVLESVSPSVTEYWERFI